MKGVPFLATSRRKHHKACAFATGNRAPENLVKRLVAASGMLDASGTRRFHSANRNLFGALLVFLMLVGTAYATARQCGTCDPGPFNAGVHSRFYIGDLSGEFCDEYWGAQDGEFDWVETAASDAQDDWNARLADVDADWQFVEGSGGGAIEILVTAQGVSPGTIKYDPATNQMRVHCNMQNIDGNEGYNYLDHEFGHMADLADVNTPGCSGQTAMYYTNWTTPFTGLTDTDKCRIRENFGDDEEEEGPLPTIVSPGGGGFEFLLTEQSEKLVPMGVSWRMPRTWEEALNGADLIAVVRIAEFDYEENVDRGGSTYVLTRYRADVTEVLKDHRMRRRANQIDIVRQGGVMVQDNTRVRYYDPSFADYATGDERIVFLTWDPEVDGYSPFGGPGLTYLLDRAAQRVISPTEVLNAEDADTPATFLAFLRAQLRR